MNLCALGVEESEGAYQETVRFQRLTSGSWQEYRNGMGLFVKRVEGGDLVIRREKNRPKRLCVIT